MDVMEFLLEPFEIQRHLTNMYYIGMALICVLAVVLAYKRGFIRVGAFLWLSSGLICLIWEVTLFLIGSRHYSFNPWLELSYHAFTEAGPGLIITFVTADALKIIDMSQLSDASLKKRSRKVLKELSKKMKPQEEDA